MGYDKNKYQHYREDKAKQKETVALNMRRLVECMKTTEIKEVHYDGQHKHMWDILPMDLQQMLVDMSSTSRQFNQSRLLNKMFDGDLTVGSIVTAVDAMKRTLKGIAGLEKIIRDAEGKGYEFASDKCLDVIDNYWRIVKVPEDKNV